MIQFEKYKLKNNLTVIVHQDKSTPMACLNIIYDVGARDEGRGRRAADRLKARFIHLDVTDDGSVAAAAVVIAAAGGLDVLINNAGIAESSGDIGDGESSVGEA